MTCCDPIPTILSTPGTGRNSRRLTTGFAGRGTTIRARENRCFRFDLWHGPASFPYNHASGKPKFTAANDRGTSMPFSRKRPALLLCFMLPLCGIANPSQSDTDRMKQTRAVNIDKILEAQFTEPAQEPGFGVSNPYADSSRLSVEQWYATSERDTAVCALRFEDETRDSYSLQDFPDRPAAEAAGFMVTHHGRCGSCSSLQDLAIYIDTPDLTTPARACSRKMGGAKSIKKCYIAKVGFTESCAESWTYNSRNTRQQCTKICTSDYGAMNLMLNRYPGPNTDADGNLRPCLQCDEDQSGAGFKYSAGRTRRNSGIESAIERHAGETLNVDHSLYFRDSIGETTADQSADR